MESRRILVVDDDDTLRRLLAGELRSRGFVPGAAESIGAAKASLAELEPDLALIDLHLPDGGGLDLLAFLRAHHPRVEVVVLTGHGSIETAIEAMRAGAFDYLRKPCPVEELEVVLHRALEHQGLLERNSILRQGLAPPDLGGAFVGRSPSFQTVCGLIDRVAATDSTVLVLGETGVGKEVVAKLIHARSARADQPLVVVECAALHEELLNSELFGHEKGSYTGATQAKHGLFEVADKGTIFLDEIGDVSPTTQVKLLRVIETGTFRRVGGTKEVKVDVRIVAATNRDLMGMIERGYFRKDLYYRLNTIRIDVPPLRERMDDVPALVDHFLGRLNARFGQRRRFSEAALARLNAYPWPGNVRELQHVAERAVILADSEVIDVGDLPVELQGQGPEVPGGLLSLEEVERRHITRVLEQVGGNRSRAAEILRIGERTLYRKLKEYGLSS